MNSYTNIAVLLVLFFEINGAIFSENLNDLIGEAYEYEAISFDENAFDFRSNEILINFNTNRFGKTFSLRLKKASNIFHPNFNLISLENGPNNQPKFTQLNVSTPSIYIDTNYKSVLHIKSENNSLQAEGILTPDLTLLPAYKLTNDPKTRDKHLILKPVEKTLKKSDRIDFIPPSRILSTSDDEILPELVTPELLIIVDYKSAKTFNFDSSAIVKYLAIFWNAVNTRYALMVDPQVQLKLTNAVIVKDPRSQSYLENFRIGDYVDYLEALPHFAVYMYKNAKDFPKYDIVMVMTAEDLAGDEGGGEYDNTYTGIAIAGGACQWDHNDNLTLSVGIAEDTPPFYGGVLYHAHEVAHLLGAVHDGDPPAEHLPGSPGAELCPFKDGFIMSYKHGSKNKAYWSKCTMEQIRWYLRTKEAKCLLENTSGKYVTLNNTLPGELVSLDEQCRHLGANAKVYKRQNKFALCVALYCEDEKGDFSTIGPALEGTPCGISTTPDRSRWCKDGECVLKT